MSRTMIASEHHYRWGKIVYVSVYEPRPGDDVAPHRMQRVVPLGCTRLQARRGGSLDGERLTAVEVWGDLASPRDALVTAHLARVGAYLRGVGPFPGRGPWVEWL